MNQQEKNQFLVDRLNAVGQKIVAKVEAKRIPSADEMAFFKKCYAAVCSTAPNQEARAYWMTLPDFVEEAKASRLAFLQMKAQALSRKAAEIEAMKRGRRVKLDAARQKGAVLNPKDLAEIEAAMLSPRPEVVTE